MDMPDPSLPFPIVREGVALICAAENLRLRAYQCPTGIWTIGWGRTANVVPGMTCTKEQADRWLCEELTARLHQVQSLLTVHAEPHRLAALLSLHYNIGHGAFAGSTVLKAHNRGDFAAAARAFGLWDKGRKKSTGKLEQLEGLVIRRAAEAALYLKPEPDAQPVAMPQATASESSLLRSPLAQGGALTAVVGALDTDLAQQIELVRDVMQQARSLLIDTLHVPPDQVQPVVLLAIGGAIMWWRWYQRKQGWA